MHNTYNLRGFIYTIYRVLVIERNYDHEYELVIERIQEFTRFSVKNGSVKVTLSSDKSTPTIYMFPCQERERWSDSATNANSLLQSACLSVIERRLPMTPSLNGYNPVRINHRTDPYLQLTCFLSLNECTQTRVTHWLHLTPDTYNFCICGVPYYMPRDEDMLHNDETMLCDKDESQCQPDDC